jgi:predicted Na+-dependent transporter
MAVLAGLAWVGARARWILALGVLVATLLPSLSAALRPALPALVVLVFSLSMTRLDLAALARRACRPRRLAVLGGWTLALMVGTPVLVWAAGSAAGMDEAHLAAITYTFAAPPITSSAALCLLVGLEAGFALELTVFASLATPFIGPVVIKLLLGETVPLDAVQMALRVAALVGGGTLAAVVVRHLAGPETIRRHAGAFDGVATVVLLLFVIPLFDGFWDLVRGAPWFALGTLGLVLAANWGAQALVAGGLRREADPDQAGAAGLMWGNRNVSLYLAALPPDPLFTLYVGFYQIPMLYTPLVMARVLRGRKTGSGTPEN